MRSDSTGILAQISEYFQHVPTARIGFLQNPVGPWYMPRFLGLVLLAMSQCCCFSGLAKFAQRQPSTMVLLRHGEREDYIAQKASAGQ